MKYDVKFKFTTDNSVTWVGISEISTGKDLGTHRLTCDELAEWLLERKGELEKKKIEMKIGIKQYGIEQEGDKRMPDDELDADRNENEELRTEIMRLELEVAEQQSEFMTLETSKTTLLQQRDGLFERNNEQAKALLELVRAFDHPNHDAPKRRYLLEIETAIRLLRIQDSEESHGTATQLSQFIQRAKAALIVPLLDGL